MDILLQSIILSFVQGLTEFLPISSSSHLILLPKLAGWDDHGITFDTTVHLGTLTAVVFHYRAVLLRNSINSILPTEYHPFILIGIATIPVCIIGYLFEPMITLQLRDPRSIAIATIFFGLLLWVADRSSKKNHSPQPILTLFHALLIGGAQAFALIPGTSRTGVTLTAALLLGLSRTHATHFSFLLAIPIIIAAASFGGLKFTATPSIEMLPILLLNFALSAIIALTTIRFFLAFVEKIGLLPFIIYRLILGGLIFFLFGQTVN